MARLRDQRSATGRPYTHSRSGAHRGSERDRKSTIAGQWIRQDGSHQTHISGAASETCTLTNGDLGKRSRVRVSFTDGRGNAEALTSRRTWTVVRRQLNCSTRTGNDWCTELLVESRNLAAGPLAMFHGYAALGKSGDGLLEDKSFTWEGTTYNIGEIAIYNYDSRAEPDVVVFAIKGRDLPNGTVINPGGTTFRAASGKSNVSGLHEWRPPGGFNRYCLEYVAVSARLTHVTCLPMSDTEASGGDDPTLDFGVTLSSTAESRVTVNYATTADTATAGSDNTAARGTLTLSGNV